MILLRAPLATLLLGSALALTSCGTFGTYAKNRILDLSDIVDVKYGFAVGLGVKVEASMYLGVGLGAAVYDCREWYGRRSVMSYDQLFLHGGLAGWDGGQEPFDNGENATDWYAVVLPINLAAIDHPTTPPRLQRWRFGGEVILPMGMGGAYLNVGEIVDFLVGLVNIDIAQDDGVSPNEKYASDFGVQRLNIASR